MQCLACGADNKMLLMAVVQDDTMKVPVIERQIYMCSSCRHIARRLVFRRAKMPVTHLPVIAVPIDKLWKERVVAQNLGERGREAPQQTDRPQRESSSSEDRCLDEGGREGPQQTGLLRNKQQSRAV